MTRLSPLELKICKYRQDSKRTQDHLFKIPYNFIFSPMLLNVYNEENFHRENLAMRTHVSRVSRVILKLHEDMLVALHFWGANHSQRV